MMEKEIRKIGDIQIRAIDGQEVSRKVEGYTLLFDVESNYIGYYETIQRGAITQELIDNCDIFALFNHDDDEVLARSNMGSGSLTLTVDEKGLKYEFDAPNTDIGNRLLEHIKRGDISQSSFAFCIDPNDNEAETWESKDGVYFRTIKKIYKVFDVSPVWKPAYADTTVSKRAASKIEELNAQKIEAICKNLDKELKEVEDLAKID